MANPTPQQPPKPRIDPAAMSIGNRNAATDDYKRKLLARINQVRDGRAAHNAGAFRNGDPDYVYCWVYNHPQEIDRYKAMFYEIVKGDDPVETSFKKEDGHHQRGDTIAMRCEKLTAEAHNALRDLNAIEAIDGRKQELENWGNENGVPIHRKN